MKSGRTFLPRSEQNTVRFSWRWVSLRCRPITLLNPVSGTLMLCSSHSSTQPGTLLNSNVKKYLRYFQVLAYFFQGCSWHIFHFRTCRDNTFWGRLPGKGSKTNLTSVLTNFNFEGEKNPQWWRLGQSRIWLQLEKRRGCKELASHSHNCCQC